MKKSKRVFIPSHLDEEDAHTVSIFGGIQSACIGDRNPDPTDARTMGSTIDWDAVERANRI